MTASCISPLSFPPALLSWYINSDSADPSFVSNQSEMAIQLDNHEWIETILKSKIGGQFNSKSDEDLSSEVIDYFNQKLSLFDEPPVALYTLSSKKNLILKNKLNKKPAQYSILKLKFIVKNKHLKGTDGGVSLKCTAEVLDLYWRSSEVSVHVSSVPHWSLPAFSYSATVTLAESYLLLLLCIAFETKCISKYYSYNHA